MPDLYTVIQKRIQEVLATIVPERKPKIIRLTAEYHMPYDQLLNRYNEISLKDSHSYALTDHKKQTLHQYIQRLDGLRMSYRRSMLTKAANSILRERSNPLRRVSNH